MLDAIDEWIGQHPRIVFALLILALSVPALFMLPDWIDRQSEPTPAPPQKAQPATERGCDRGFWGEMCDSWEP